MKKIMLLFAIVATAIFSYAQSPAPDPDTLNNPVKQIDPEVKTEPADIHYVDEQVRVGVDQLPSAVLDSLKKLEPAAWEKSVIYQDKSKKSYRVEVREGGEERTYRFTATGKRIKNEPARKEK